MSKRNLTIQLDEEVITSAKVIAVQRGTSVSALVTQYLREIAQDAERYEYAKQQALQLMAEAEGHGGRVTWTREELYDRGEQRHA
ncbi:DUF6364 domain-containing protein [Nocardia ninae]|uniref:CopG family transcriptional regulator n=1 Tax=Nocardia ninae NBRC 108245 TaxID=1210091 RepID=A0A511MBS9_9NOCA|nr:DUF6364 family protein [Nocardia ninae]GEM37216.1 hypothetical protein NN4_17350 [Nocardia ninae NBRC 108245]